MTYLYDIIIIGAGPGGYSAAVTSAQENKRVCIIEKNELGGVCVNKGCIPTKTILSTALLCYKLKNQNKVINYSHLQDRVKDVVSSIKKGMEQVININKIDLINGHAELVNNETVKVGDKEIKAKKIIVATGSKPKKLGNFNFDGKRILGSEDFLTLNELPKSVLIVGAGIIGCEWAGILANLGVSVTLSEMQEKILPFFDSDLTRVVETSLKKMGVEIKLNAVVSEITQEKAIICIGREPVTEGLNILEKKEGGWIKVNKYLETNVPGVYAVGDCIGQQLLAYTAEREGKIAANNALGKEIPMEYNFVPRVVFSIPELASVGLRECEASNAGVVRAYFKGLGKALADSETEGFVKIIYDKADHKILGIGITGKNASELISEAVLALKCGLTTDEWGNVIRPHPVLSEIFSVALGKETDRSS